MKGKICLVTGGTSGIGEVTARSLAQLGATVGVVGRAPERTEAVVAEIKRRTGNPDVVPFLADLSSQRQVRDLAGQIRHRFASLDVLVNNAGAFFSSRQTSVDGVEMTLALNHLAYFLLSTLLLDRLKAGARIVNVSGSTYRLAGSLNFNDLQGLGGYNGWLAYSRSKLCNLLFTYELARRLDGTGVTVNALHPGVISSRFGHNSRGPVASLVRFTNLFTMGPERGAETVIYLATSSEVAGVTGKYFVRKKVTRSSAASTDNDAAAQLWQVSEALTCSTGRADSGTTIGSCAARVPRAVRRSGDNR